MVYPRQHLILAKLLFLAKYDTISAMKSNHKYFPVNDTQRRWGIYATCTGHSQTEPGYEFPTPVHPDEYFFSWEMGRTLHEWQIILIEHGRGTVEFRNRRFTAKEGSLIVLPPECWHRYRPNRKTGWTTLWIGFGGDLAARLIGGAGFNTEGEVRDVSDIHRFKRLFADTITDILELGHDNVYSTAARIPSLVAALMENSSPNAIDISCAETIHRAQRHIVEHTAEIIDFAALAESLGVPYRTFRYLFAKETGTSPLQYQLEIRLSRAKALLKSSDMPISDIASVLGFRSAWYFAHFFQKRVKASAAAYRKRYRLQMKN